MGRNEEALLALDRAIVSRSDFSDAFNNRGNALLAVGKFEDALASYQRALEINPDYDVASSNQLLALAYLPAFPPEQLLAESRRFGRQVAERVLPYSEWCGSAQPDRCLRVGLVSGDFRNHPVGWFLQGVLAALVSKSADRVEIYAYSAHACSDDVTERLKACCRIWRSVDVITDENLARTIHGDRVDILIDLSGHTAFNRLPVFAWKPAPVQVSWLGYFATTGLAAVDYLIADPWTLPESEEKWFSEKIWRLPETRLCFSSPNLAVCVSPLPALSNGYVTFGCFNNLSKMNETVVAVWAKVLSAVPGSRLFLKSKQLNDPAECQKTIGRFLTQGIAAERLIVEGSESRARYFASYHRVDIALDPFPFTGGTTTVESLWMGVPTLTLAGERFVSRQGVGVLQNAGLPDWIAIDSEDYIRRAAKFAEDLEGLATLRAKLREQVLASPIFDTCRFGQHLEAALRGMWVQWCESFHSASDRREL